jgi:hypothetical protein
VLNNGSGGLITSKPRSPRGPGSVASSHEICELVFVRSCGFRVIEHDPERPWLIVGSGHHQIELEPDIDFYQWAREQWPADRFTVQLDPWSLTPK